jgi:site-specific recombinase XerC
MSGTNESSYNWYNLEPNFRIYLSAVKKIQPISIKNYLSDLRYFFGWISTTVSPASNEPKEVLVPAQLEAFRAYLIQSNLPDRTINRRLSTLRAFCDFLISQNVIVENPSKAIRNYAQHEEKEPMHGIRAQFMEDLQRTGLSGAQLEEQIEDIHEFIDLAQIKAL